MSYLKVFPRWLHVLHSDSDALHGFLSFDVEQYGLSLKPMTFNLDLVQHPGAKKKPWTVAFDRMDAVNLKGAELFEQVLNVYLFSEKGHVPFFATQDGTSAWNVHFDEVSFELTLPSS